MPKLGKTTNFRWIFLVGWLAAALAWGQAMVLEVIPLGYRTADQGIPVLQPMIAPGGTISGLKNQLGVRTTPENLAEIKRILASVDRVPRKLLISVRQDVQAARNERGGEISGRVGNDNARVVVPGSGDRSGGQVVIRQGDDRVSGRVFDSSSTASERGTQTVQVLEGREAYVQVGQSAPYTQREVRRTVVGGRVVDQVVDSTQYRDANTGFYVLPRVNGDVVTMEISPQRESFTRGASGAVQTQRVVTSVLGRLGEWMEIGGVSRTGSSQQSVLLGRTATSGSDQRSVWVKVDEVR